MKYLKRWPIETFYRDGKQLLGLDAYRTRSFSAIDAHWCFVFVAYTLLHLDTLPPPAMHPSGPRPTTPSKTIGEVCHPQGQALIERLILWTHELLQQGVAASEVFSRLFAKQQKGVA